VTEHPTTGTYTKIVSGGSHSCALSTDAKIVCWGDDLYGQTQVP
jgi:alpha-tubulin suppressor-like RCC1 family protein